ncbi:FadR family transcriptional regulator [Microbacterium sp. LRZ72]|uniref:FadR/GntR family transcriptional regulator n=1 Tax=Microbacterium sp. LRZ72 TaxID=2942481 RepID=UPI0029B18B65|nr:FadR/GntR family transcriptional regulator [Microbacterium sp. LRZ72]MDX2376893.1 FadR family transcriptional regulator [Microbacterium sp. LRZ72]
MQSPTDARKAWQVVLEHIEAGLIDGRFTPGDRLPPERELATTLGVGRSSVREALRVLEVLGLVRTGTGSGPAAGAIIIATPHGGMAALLRLQVAAQGFPLGDIVQTRLLLEGGVVDSLARAGDADLAPAVAVLDAMERDDLTAAEFLALDAQFHLTLAEASGNIVVAAVMAGLRSSIEDYVREGAERITDWAGTAARLRQEHRRILTAVREGDPEGARARIQAHITGYYDHAGLARS